MGTSTSLTAWSHTTLSLTAFGRAGSGTALKKTHGKGQTACRFTNCAPFSESAKGESPKRSSMPSRNTSGMPQGTNVSSPWNFPALPGRPRRTNRSPELIKEEELGSIWARFHIKSCNVVFELFVFIAVLGTIERAESTGNFIFKCSQ